MELCGDGFKLRIQLVPDGPFVDVSGQKSLTITDNKEQVEITNKGSIGSWRGLLENCGTKSRDITLTGVVTEQALAILCQRAVLGEIHEYLIVSTIAVGIAQFKAEITSVDRDGAHNDAEAVSISLQMTGPLLSTGCEQLMIDDGWHQSPHTGNWFRLSETIGQLPALVAEATARGGTLAKIPNADETDWITNTLLIGIYGVTAVSPLAEREPFIGLEEIGEGNWFWFDGEAVTYTNWADGEPNNSGGIESHATLLLFRVPKVNGSWNDVYQFPSPENYKHGLLMVTDCTNYIPY